MIDLNHCKRDLILPRDVTQIASQLHVPGNVDDPDWLDPNLDWVEHPLYDHPIARTHRELPTRGLAVPQESYEGRHYQIWQHRVAYSSTASQLDRKLALESFSWSSPLFSRDHAATTPAAWPCGLRCYNSSLLGQMDAFMGTHPVDCIGDWCAMNGVPLVEMAFTRPRPAPRFTFQIVDHIMLNGERTPVFDGRPLADEYEIPDANLDWNDLLTISTGL